MDVTLGTALSKTRLKIIDYVEQETPRVTVCVVLTVVTFPQQNRQDVAFVSLVSVTTNAGTSGTVFSAKRYVLKRGSISILQISVSAALWTRKVALLLMVLLPTFYVYSIVLDFYLTIVSIVLSKLRGVPVTLSDLVDRQFTATML